MSRQAVIDAVKAELADDPSYFRAALLREDLERLTGLRELSTEAEDEASVCEGGGAGRLDAGRPADP